MSVRKDEIHVATLRELAEAHVEIARLTKALDEREADMHMRIRAGYDKTVADAWRAEVEKRDAEIARLTAELAAARAVAVDVCRYLDCSESDLLAVVTSLYESRARAISDATAARGTVGGLLATADEPEAPRPQCPTHGDTVNCYCTTGALHCHDCGHTPPFCTACDGYHDAGPCPLPKGG